MLTDGPTFANGLPSARCVRALRPKAQSIQLCWDTQETVVLNVGMLRSKQYETDLFFSDVSQKLFTVLTMVTDLKCIHSFLYFTLDALASATYTHV